MDWGRRSKWDDAGRRKTLALSLGHVEQWAKTREDCFDPQTMKRAWEAAHAAKDVVVSFSASTALKYMGGGREDFRFLLDLERRLHEKPKGDQDRCNPVLRTALRRVDNYLTEIGATFQYC